MALERSCDIDEIERGLTAAWLTDQLNDQARHRLARLATLAEVGADAALTREGEPTANLAIVLDGRVALSTLVPERGMVTILTVEPGDVVGWSALVPPYRATSTAIALVPTRLALFDGARLRAELQGAPDLAAAVYPLVLRAVARRLEGTRLQLLDLFTQRQVEPW